jgi:hypothetical protein
MAKQALGQTLTIVGILVVVLSALADPLRIGQYPGFGWRQITGVVVGLVITWFGFRKRSVTPS